MNSVTKDSRPGVIVRFHIRTGGRFYGDRISGDAPGTRGGEEVLLHPPVVSPLQFESRGSEEG